MPADDTSSNVNLGTLCGNGRCCLIGSSQSPAPTYLPLHLSHGISSLLPCPFQISSLHPHPPWSLLTISHVSSLMHLFPISQYTAAKFIF